MEVTKSQDVSLKDEQFSKSLTNASDGTFSEKHDADVLTKKKSQIYTHWPLILTCLSAAAFHLPFGTITGFTSILIPQLEALDSEIKITKHDMSWLASIYPLMVPLGALISGYLVDRIGRINTLKVGALPYLASWVCIATAPNLEMLLIGRTLSGITSAMVSSPAFIYIPEAAAPELRGFLLGMAPAICALGTILVYAKGAYLHWRSVAWVSSVYCVIPLALMHFWSVESPLWLVSRGRKQDALHSLHFLLRNRRSEAGVADKYLDELVKEHDLMSSTTTKTDSPIKTLLKGLSKPNGYKPFLLLLMIFIFQQFSGIYITIFYGVTLFQEVGTTVDPYLSTVGIGVVRLVFGLLVSMLMKSVGRRPLYLISSLGMAVFMFLAGYITKQVATGLPTPQSSIGVVRLVFGLLVSVLMKSVGRRPLYLISSLGMAVFMFLAGYITKQVATGEMESNIAPAICIWIYMSLGVVGFVTLPWTMTGEIFPIEIRGMAQGIIYSLAHLLMFTALKIFPFLPVLLGGIHSVLWLFATVSLSAAVFIYIFCPETHRRTLAQIQEYFQHNTVYVLGKSKEMTREEVVSDVAI